MYPYYFMNPQMGSSVNSSVNPSINPTTINPSMSSQYGIPMGITNSYMNYSANPSMGMNPYNSQLKNTHRNLPASGIPFGMSPYSTSPGANSIYPPQYVSSYPTGMMGGYGQNPPPSFSHMMGLDKN
jgi:hypothetical protein